MKKVSLQEIQTAIATVQFFSKKAGDSKEEMFGHWIVAVPPDSGVEIDEAFLDTCEENFTSAEERAEFYCSRFTREFDKLRNLMQSFLDMGPRPTSM